MSTGYRPTKRTSLLIQRVIAAWREFGAGYPSFVSFCEGQGFSVESVRKARKAWPEFREQLDAIADGWKLGKPTVDMDTLRLRYPGLDEWKQLWLEKWRTTSDRMEAADSLGKTWDDLEKELATDVAFAAAYARVEKELNVRVEDALAKNARAGRSASQSTFLEANMPGKYRKKIDHTMRGKIALVPGGQTAPQPSRERWGAIYHRAQPALPVGGGPPMPAPDVVDGETVETDDVRQAVSGVA